MAVGEVIADSVMFGGGDPDRTGDPRLMSPLLCQLSYTATSKALACEDTILPEEGSLCPRRNAGVSQWFMSAGDEDDGDGDAGFG